MTKSSDQYELIPPYCPNPQCLFHFGSEEKFYAKNGFSITNKPPFRNQRFKCAKCKIQFSTNTFGLDFRKQVTCELSLPKLKFINPDRTWISSLAGTIESKEMERRKNK